MLFSLPATALAQGNNPSARLIPLPSSAKGFSFNLGWDADLFGNLDGGVRRGYATDSLLSAGLGLDTGALGWWRGGRFVFGAQAIASTHPSEYAGDLQTLSNIDAPDRRYVSELWYSQSFGDTALVRAGIMFMENFFDTNDTAGLFINSSYGVTPTLPANVPTSVYPDPGWGVMARIGKRKNGWLLGVFQGDPVHRSTTFRRGAMAVAERDWQTAGGTQLGIGAWYRHAPEAAAPTSDWGAYANLEQALGHSNVSVFGQLGASPGDVNDVPIYLGGGVVLHHASPVVSDIGFAFARA